MLIVQHDDKTLAGTHTLTHTHSHTHTIHSHNNYAPKRSKTKRIVKRGRARADMG